MLPTGLPTVASYGGLDGDLVRDLEAAPVLHLPPATITRMPTLT